MSIFQVVYYVQYNVEAYYQEPWNNKTMASVFPIEVPLICEVSSAFITIYLDLAEHLFFFRISQLVVILAVAPFLVIPR